MERKWRLWYVAVVVGLATVTRLTGVALLLPLAMHVWRIAGSGRRAAATFAALMPLALGGLLMFVLFQQLWQSTPRCWRVMS